MALAQRSSLSRAGISRKTSVKVQAVAQPANRNGASRGLAAAVVATTFWSQVQAARADDVDSAVAAATDAVKAGGVAARTAIELLSSGAKLLQQGYEAAAPVIQQGVEAATPVVQSALKATTETALPALKSAAPVVTDTLNDALRATGLDANTVSNTASTLVKTAASGAAAATPVVNQALAFFSGKDPTTLAEYGLGAGALYLLAPVLLGAVGGSLRGFAGELTAAAALDLINSDGGAVLVDIRTAKEKDSTGLPDVAGSARDRSIEVEYAFTEDRKLRGQLRDASAVEQTVTALTIASLKRVSKGSRVILLDKNGGSAKGVAKELSRCGFGKVYVVAGGFDGRGGWVQSKLLIKPSAGAFVSQSPIANLARTISTRTNSTRKSLPAPSKA